jgi:hypothetical protein
MKPGLNEMLYLRQIPGPIGQWGDCRFVADPNLEKYDWLIVYDDLPPAGGERHSLRVEKLACPPENTIFVMAEPSSIKTYGYDFLNQFGTIISCHGEKASPEHKTIHTIPGLIWFYGMADHVAYDVMAANPPLQKSNLMSIVYSAKVMKHTLHGKRNEFTRQLSEALPEMDVFGKNHIPLHDKRACLDSYRYHFAMENTLQPNYISEKLTDAFLGLSLPFYVGAPNAEAFFPAGSFIRLDPDQPEEAVCIIRDAIKNNEYEKRLPALMEARRRVMEEYNLFAMARKIIEGKPQTISSGSAALLFSHRAILKSNGWVLLKFLYQKMKSRFMHSFVL